MRDALQGREAVGRTGHADHFLRRLDRVSDADVERALALYRDAEMLREVLSRARIGGGAERVAISLDDPVNGPFLIVTRTGAFVTCLGRGMRVTIDDRLALVTRGELDAAASKVTRMRERLAAVDRLVRDGHEGAAARAFRHLADAGLRFCREDAETLLSAAPLVATDLAKALMHCGTFLTTRFDDVAALRLARPRPHEEPLALAFGRAAWAFSHLVVLADHPQVRGVHAEINADGRLPPLPLLCAATSFALGTNVHAVRGLWLLARRPTEALAGVVDLDLSPTAQHHVLREAGLGAIALAAPRLRSDAKKAMHRAGDGGDGPSAFLDRQVHAAARMVTSMLSAPAIAAAEHLAYGRSVSSRAAWPRVADADARTIAGVRPASWVDEATGTDVLRHVIGAIPWLVRARPADLFPPRAVAATIPDTPLRDVATMMAPFARAAARSRPLPLRSAHAKAGRNDPCACGSGRKHKRCCGAVAEQHARAA